MSTALADWEVALLQSPTVSVQVVNEPATITIVDLGSRKAVSEPLPWGKAHARLERLKAEHPHRRFTLTGVHHG